MSRHASDEECLQAVGAAVDLARTADPTPENVEKLGEEWVADEPLATSLFCALKAEGFAQGVRLAVNHSGDSDSTGAITGNIPGGLWGVSAIPKEFLAEMEPREVVEEMAVDVTSIRLSQHYGENCPTSQAKKHLKQAQKVQRKGLSGRGKADLPGC